MNPRSFLSNNRRILSSVGLVSLMPLLFSSLVTTLLIQQQAFFEALALSQWIPLFALSTLTMALAMTPTTFVAIVSGYFLGWQAVPLMIMAYLVASVLGFGLGKTLDGGRFLNSFARDSTFQQLVTEMKQRDWALMILVRISPVLPFSMINLLLPATGIRFSTFVGAGFIGMLPRTLFSVWLGQQAYTLVDVVQSTEEQTLMTLLLIVTTVVSAGGLLWIFLRSWRHMIKAKKG